MPVIQFVNDIEPKVVFQRLQETFPPVYIDTSAHDNGDTTCTVLRDYIQFAQRNRIATYPIIDYQSMQYIPLLKANGERTFLSNRRKLAGAGWREKRGYRERDNCFASEMDDRKINSHSL